jgi:hypothetical protein
MESVMHNFLPTAKLGKHLGELLKLKEQQAGTPGATAMSKDSVTL